MLNTTNISALLRWAMENIGYPLDEINALDGTVHIRLSDGRTGFLYMGEDGCPRAVLPAIA